MDEKFWKDQKPKEYFMGTKSNVGIFRGTIYLFNPTIKLVHLEHLNTLTNFKTCVQNKLVLSVPLLS